MRERRVAEIVEGTEGLADASSLERRLEIDAGELARVERRSLLRVAEDEFLLALEGTRAPVLGEQVLRAWSELDHPARGARLRGRETTLDERLSNSHLSLKQADVLPAKRK